MVVSSHIEEWLKNPGCIHLWIDRNNVMNIVYNCTVGLLWELMKSIFSIFAPKMPFLTSLIGLSLSYGIMEKFYLYFCS